MSVALETLKLELGAALSATPARAAWLWTDEPQLFDGNGRFAPRRGELVGLTITAVGLDYRDPMTSYEPFRDVDDCANALGVYPELRVLPPERVAELMEEVGAPSYDACDWRAVYVRR